YASATARPPREPITERRSPTARRPRPREHPEFDAPIVRPSGLGVVAIDRLNGPVADRLDPALGHAHADQVALDRLGAVFRQLQVVIVLALIVGVTGDLDSHVGILHEDLHGLVEHRDRAAANRGLVGVECDALDAAGEALDVVGQFVGAAVLVLKAVLGLGLADALVDVVEDPVAVGVADRAAVGIDPGLVGAAVLIVPVAVAVAVLL